MNFKRHIFLMYCGSSADGQDYRKWNTVETEPVLAYKNGPVIESFFPAVLLLAIRSGSGKSLIPGFGEPGNKEDWLAWLDDIFTPDYNLRAMAQVIINNNLPPVDIWVAVPYPDPKQKLFGRIFSKQLDFSRNDDRQTALKWWINRFLAKWNNEINKPGLNRYLNLKGFYWLRESLTPRDRAILPGFISYVKYQGLLTLWIPYYAVTPLLNLQNPGFDLTIIQPSYLQNPQKGWNRLVRAFKRAKKYGSGIEIEFDTSALYPDSVGYRVAIDYLNRGLPQFEGYMRNMPVAYYTGYKTIISLFKNGSPLYDYLFRFVKGTLTKIDYPGISY